MKLKQNIAWGSVCTLLLSVIVYQTYRYRQSLQQIENLQQEMEVLVEKEQKASVVRRISKQMEEIAYQQKDISDKQREEAIAQTQLANQMRDLAEVERVKAEGAEAKASSSYHMALAQREIAEQKQQQAEYAKQVADTLSFLALGRSLGSLSSTQYQSGNYDVASLLAYSSWMFTSRYQGDVYQPVIFNALAASSHSIASWRQQHGAITAIVPDPHRANRMVTVSKYGEILAWQVEGDRVSSEPLFSDSQLDFRDLYIDSDQTIYALSYNGVLVIQPLKEKVRRVNLNVEGTWRLCPAEALLYVVTKERLYAFDRQSFQLKAVHPFRHPVTAVGQKEGQYCFFTAAGRYERLTANRQLQSSAWEIQEEVSSFCWSAARQIGAVGTASGHIYLVDRRGSVFNVLSGHRSRISSLNFYGEYVVATSYDRTVSLWDLRKNSQEPVVLTDFSFWNLCSHVAADDVVWVGDASGALMRIHLSPDQMARKIRESLQRDFTQEEWEYYMNAGIPFERLKP